MKSVIFLLPVLAFLLVAVDGGSLTSAAPAGTAVREGQPAPPKGGADERLAAREAALAAREKQLEGMTQDLLRRERETAEGTKKLEAAKQEAAGKLQQMVKVYGGLRPEVAGRLLARLDTATAHRVLSLMDRRSLVKIIPHLPPERVTAWTTATMAAAGEPDAGRKETTWKQQAR